MNTPDSLTLPDITERSFYVQYTSLMLIILAVLIGSLYAPPPQVKTPPAKKLEINAASHIGSMRFNNLFDPSTQRPNGEVVQSLAVFLQSHDVQAAVTISGNGDGPSAVAVPLGKGISLLRALEKAGAPQGSVAVTTALNEKRSEEGVHVAFSKNASSFTKLYEAR